MANVSLAEEPKEVSLQQENLLLKSTEGHYCKEKLEHHH